MIYWNLWGNQMNKLQSIIAFICKNYPHDSELTKARLTKMVYLADWVSAILDDRQLTDVNWIFNHYGPYVEDVVDAARSSAGFKMETQPTMYGNAKSVISFDGDDRAIDLTDKEKNILSAVISKTKTMYFNSFIDYIYSTYPVKTKERYSTLDLVALAKDFKKEKESREKVLADSH
jgi:hypothetical protein